MDVPGYRKPTHEYGISFPDWDEQATSEVMPGDALEAVRAELGACHA